MHLSPINISTQPLSQARITILIEEFVQAIEHSSEPAFYVTLSSSKHEQVVNSSLSRWLNGIDQLLSVYADYYVFSEHLEVFWKACRQIGLGYGPTGLACLDADGNPYLSFAQSMNALIDRIRQLTHETGFKRKEHDRRYQANQKRTTLEHYVRAILNQYSRTVVVRVDLHYRDEFAHLIRIDDLVSDLKTLIRAKERNEIFKHEIGYAWSIEQGEDRGFHIHCAFFFNSSHVYSDWHKAQTIGELWVQITAGRGYTHNCNANKKKYVRVGVGTIKRDDEQACDNVVSTLLYLTKDNQYLRIKPPRMRCFGTGTHPKAKLITDRTCLAGGSVNSGATV